MSFRKILIIFTALAASLIIFSSCAKESPSASPAGNEVSSPTPFSGEPDENGEIILPWD